MRNWNASSVFLHRRMMRFFSPFDSFSSQFCSALMLHVVWDLFIFLRHRTIYLPYLFCQQRDNPVVQCFPRSSVAREKASSLGINTTHANTQVFVVLIVGKSLNPFRQVLCNHWPLKRRACLMGLPACSTRWLNLGEDFCRLQFLCLSSGYNVWHRVQKHS